MDLIISLLLMNWSGYQVGRLPDSRGSYHLFFDFRFHVVFILMAGGLLVCYSYQFMFMSGFDAYIL